MAILFTNTGAVPIQGFTTFGINSKVTDNPIGRFGTGIKYGLATILRLGGTLRLVTGGVEYCFYTSKKDFRDKSFDFVRMRKLTALGRWTYSTLAYTTELGKDWEPWMAVREFEANTRDENGCSACADESSVKTAIEYSLRNPDSTCIVVDCEEFENEYLELDSIFLPIEEMSLLHENESVQIFEGANNAIYFRGMRVTDIRLPSLMTYNLKSGVSLTEDRTSKYPYSDSLVIMRALISCPSARVIEILTGVEEGDELHEMTLDFDTYGHSPSPELIAKLASTKGKTGNPRLEAFYGTYSYAQETIDPELELLDIELQRREWRQVIACMPEGEIRDKVLDALETNHQSSEDIPF